jgi:uncharacterized protein
MLIGDGKRRFLAVLSRLPLLAMGLAGGLGAVCAAQTGMAAFERGMIYHPDHAGQWRAATPPEPWRRIPIVDPVSGVDVFGWHRPAGPGRPTTLWLHGNADSPEGLRGIADRLSEDGSGAFLLSYRGYSGNPGRPSESGLIDDAAAALAWLRAEGAGPVFVAGHSLGTGVAAGLAERAAAEEHPVAGLLLFAPFADLPSVAERHFPLLPARLLMRDRYDSRTRLAPMVDLDVLILHGASDEVVPIAEGRALRAALGPRARLIALEGEGHAPFSAEAVAAAAQFLSGGVP